MNIGAIHEAIARAIPEHECLVFRERRFSWAEVSLRTRRLASVLRAHGLGCRRERTELENWESGQDHIALYLHNCNEYLEGMLGAYKARCAPFNVNYRYVEEELSYLFENANARAVIFHASFAPLLEKLRAQLPEVALWLEVDDGSAQHFEGALDYEAALASASPAPPEGLSPDDLYILYTGGTTGMPKGVLWRQQEILRAALLPQGMEPTLDAIVARARRLAGRARGLPAPPFMHGAAHWAAFSLWHAGGAVFVQDSPQRLDAAGIWRLIERERLTLLTIVGDAFARPLLDEIKAGNYDLSSLRTLSSGGAILSAKVKDALLTALPSLRILDVLGSSESGQQGAQVSKSGAAAVTGDFEPNADNALLAEDMQSVLEPGVAASGAVGWLARKGPVPLGYYRDQAKTERTFPVVGGVRFAVPGDRAVLTEDGGVRLLGRDSVTINSGGEKIFAEEVEHALKQHPDVYDVVVTGTPDPRWGQQVTAIVALQPGAQEDEAALRAECARHIARYKLPRAFVFVEALQRSPSGKADYRWAFQTACTHLGIEKP